MPKTVTRKSQGTVNPQITNVNYTFGRAETEEIVVRAERDGFRHDFPVRLLPNPRGLAIQAECNALSGLSKLDRWLCVHGREIIPEGMERKPTLAEICALPSQLRQAWGNDRNSYTLAVAAEFNDASDVSKLFDVRPTRVPEYWDSAPHPLVEVADGQWIQRNIPVIDTDPGRFGEWRMTGTRKESYGKMEFSSGYLEVRQLSDIPLISVDGPFFIIWSRYGGDHTKFSSLPDPGIFDAELRDARGRRVNLDRGAGGFGKLFLDRATLGRVGFLEIDFWERWLADQHGPLFVIHSYPFRASDDETTFAHGRQYTIPGDRAFSSKNYYFEFPIKGPFTTGLEINPDAGRNLDDTNVHDGIRFYFQGRDESSLSELAKDGRINPDRALLRDVVAHTAPLRISWLNFFRTYGADPFQRQCHGEIRVVNHSYRLFCKTPRQEVDLEGIQWRIDYLRLWKRRGQGLPERLGGVAPAELDPVPFECPADGG